MIDKLYLFLNIVMEGRSLFLWGWLGVGRGLEHGEEVQGFADGGIGPHVGVEAYGVFGHHF